MATCIWLPIDSGKAIAHTSGILSLVKSSDIRRGAISQEIPEPSITKISLKLLN